RFRIDAVLGEVLGDSLGVTVQRVAEAAAAGAEHLEGVARIERDAGLVDADRLDPAIGAVEEIAHRRAGIAARRSPRREPRAGAGHVADQRLGVVRLKRLLATRARAIAAIAVEAGGRAALEE